MFDPNYLIKQAGDDEPLAIELLNTFIADKTQQDVHEMMQAYDKKDWSAVEKLAHKLKGGAGYLGTHRMFYACQYLERYYKAGHRDIGVLDKLFHQLIDINKETIKNYKEIIKYACIECEAEKIKSIYIDAYKHLWPCSWLASVPYIYINPEDILYDFQKDNLESLLSKLNLFGGLSALDLSKYSIEDIIDNLNWQSIWNEGFKENTPLMCSRMCGKFNKPTIAQFKDQYINLDKF
jgi:HPt (histidine-containing phosphotransfer) domain-containing protein